MEVEKSFWAKGFEFKTKLDGIPINIRVETEEKFRDHPMCVAYRDALKTTFLNFVRNWGT